MDAIARRIAELQQIDPSPTARPDLDDFWEKTLTANANRPVKGSRQEIKTPLKQIEVNKVIYEGLDGTPVHAWFLLPPASEKTAHPCIVHFHGYTGSKGEPEDYAAWLLMGYAVLAIDIRGQGGETGSRLNHDFGMTKGWITQGILDKDTCYYKGITLDALRAIDWSLEQPEVDPERIIVMGTSQGGGLALVAAALHPKVRLSIANLPNMCHMDFGILHSTGSLTEASEFVNRFPEKLDAVLTTLSYFDVLNLAERISVPVMVSVGLKDTVCMPETVFAAFNRIPSLNKSLQIYPFAAHHLVPGHTQKVYRFIERHLEGVFE